MTRRSRRRVTVLAGALAAGAVLLGVDPAAGTGPPASIVPRAAAAHDGMPRTVLAGRSGRSVVTDPPPPPPPAPVHTAAEAEVLRLVNVERASAGCPALVANPVLVAVARAHSTDMADHRYFSHTSLDGRSPFDRMRDAGYDFRSAAENIAAGYATPADVMRGWMGSPGHRANILSCGLRELGVGRAQVAGSPYGTYWTQDFGTR